MKKEKTFTYMVQIKSKSIQKEGKGSLLIPMEFEQKEVKTNSKKDIDRAMVRDAIIMYPEYTQKEDDPLFTISRITKKELNSFLRTGIYKMEGFVGGQNEIMGN